jgi:hypothetical protein
MSEEKDYYVYFHKTLNGELFYIGKGKGGRANSKEGRNDSWHSIARDGYMVEFFMRNLSEEDAIIREQGLIAAYGALSDNRGPLVNQMNCGQLIRFKADYTKRIQLESAVQIAESLGTIMQGVFKKKVPKTVIVCPNYRDAILFFNAVYSAPRALRSNLCRYVRLAINPSPDSLKRLTDELGMTAGIKSLTNRGKNLGQKVMVTTVRGFNRDAFKGYTVLETYEPRQVSDYLDLVNALEKDHLDSIPPPCYKSLVKSTPAD